MPLESSSSILTRSTTSSSRTATTTVIIIGAGAALCAAFIGYFYLKLENKKKKTRHEDSKVNTSRKKSLLLEQQSDQQNEQQLDNQSQKETQSKHDLVESSKLDEQKTDKIDDCANEMNTIMPFVENDKNICHKQKLNEDHLVPDKSLPLSSGKHELTLGELTNSTQLLSLNDQSVPVDNLKRTTTTSSSSNDPVDLKIQQKIHQQQSDLTPKPSSRMSTSKRNNSSRQYKSNKHEHNKLNKSDIVIGQSSPSPTPSNTALPKSLSSSSSLSHQQNHQQHHYEDLVVYEFNFPRKYCGKLIGKNGVHVDFIRLKTKTQIAVRDDPNMDELQIVCVSGRLEDVDHALDIISSRFPQKNYPTVSFKPISKPIVYRRRFNADKKSLFEETKVLVAPNMFVSLESVINPTKTDVTSSSSSSSSSYERNSTRSSSISSTSSSTVLNTPSATTATTTNELFAVHVSAVVNSSLVFIQLPSNSTYESLQKLDKTMLKVYSQEEYDNLNDTNDDKNNKENTTTDDELNQTNGKNERKIPYMSEPIEFGSICVAPTSYGWHRAMVTNYVSKQEACQQFAEYNQSCGLATVKFLDYGGYLTIPTNQLRQLRSDFMLLPFQAIECYLDGIFPYEGLEEEGKRFLTEMIKGGSLKASLGGYAEDGIPLIKLYLTNETSQNLYVNAELVNYNFAYYYDSNSQSQTTSTTKPVSLPASNTVPSTEVTATTTAASPSVISTNENDNDNTSTTSPSSKPILINEIENASYSQLVNGGQTI